MHTSPHAIARASEPPDPDAALPLPALARVRPEQLERAAGSEKRRVLAAQLREALHSGDRATADTLMRLLVEQDGLHAAHRALASVLSEARPAGDWPGPLLQERVVLTTARTVLEGLRAEQAPQPSSPLVLLVAPEGDRHTLALLALSLELERGGRRTLVLDDLPDEAIAEMAASTSAEAVCISAHVRLSSRRARELTSAIRLTRPDAVIALGGPGVSAVVRGADVVTNDSRELTAVLGSRTALLTDREREVLLMVADGLTNAEIADRLCLSPATVKTHLDHIFSKTRTVHRAAAVANAFRQGWIR